MAGLSGKGRSRVDVLIGTGCVMLAMITLVILAGSHFGRTRTINFDLQAPHLTAPKAPEWMQEAAR
jgi:hypothetical protein